MPLTAPKAPGGAEVRVSLVDFEFQPKALKLAPGTTQVFVNQGQAPHTVTDNQGRFDSGVLAPGAEFRRTFTEPGTYAIYCRFHPYMVFGLEVGE
jgi:plastocyanin